MAIRVDGGMAGILPSRGALREPPLVIRQKERVELGSGRVASKLRLLMRLYRSPWPWLLFAALTGIWSRPAVATSPVASPTQKDPLDVSLAVDKTRLDNGLELVLHEDHRTPIVTVNLWYHVGSKDEPKGKNGFAHLFEHVMFQGSKHVPEDTYFLDLERVGATDINGSTSYDRTNYFETVPKNQLELALWLESDRMGFLLDHVDQATFTGQRDVVKNERRQNYENAPYGLVAQTIAAAVYPPDHPYHLLTIGTPEDLDAATLDDVKAFFRTWYVPNNATLVIAGDIDKPKTRELVGKYFGPIPSGIVPDRAKWADPQVVTLAKENVLAMDAGVELPRVYMAWPTPRAFAKGDAELDLLASVLASGKTSRLYKRLVYDLQIAGDVNVNQASKQLGSEFTIVATAQPKHTADELRKAIDEELVKLTTAGITAAELDRAKTGYLSSAIFELERDSARADGFNRYNQMAGDPGYLQKDMARYKDATADQVLGAAKQWLALDRRVVVVVTPKKGAPICGILAGGGR
jgi:zinc protease